MMDSNRTQDLTEADRNLWMGTATNHTTLTPATNRPTQQQLHNVARQLYKERKRVIAARRLLRKPSNTYAKLGSLASK